MKSFFEQGPKLIAESAKTPLGIISLIILALSFIGYMFFASSSEPVKIVMFVLIFLGFSLLGFTIVKPQLSIKSPTQPDKVDIGQNATKHETNDKVRIVQSQKDSPPFEINAIVIEQDTFLVSDAEAKVKYDGKSIKQLVSEAKTKLPLSVGTVLVRGKSPVKLITIIYDYDEAVPCREGWVKDALSKIIVESEKRKYQNIGLPPLGNLHGTITIEQFIHLLNSTLAQVSPKYLRRLWLIIPN